MSKMRNVMWSIAQLADGSYEPVLVTPPNPIYYPKKHTKQSYRSQQRARVKRNKSRGK